MTSELLKSGTPDFKTIAARPQLSVLIKECGKTNILKAVYLMIRDFCNSLNVVRNMNEDQMIEAASFLIDECGNFRLEDYQIMFAMAKRGQLGKIMDRVDIQTISVFLDEFWRIRHSYGQRQQDEYYSDNFQQRPEEGNYVPQEIVAEAMRNFRLQLEEKNRIDEEEEQRLRDERIRESQEKIVKFFGDNKLNVNALK